MKPKGSLVSIHVTLVLNNNNNNNNCENIILRKQPTFGDATTGFPAKWRLRNQRGNPILMTRHYPDLDCTSDWLKQISHAAEWSCREGHFLQPIRSTSQICVYTSSVWNFCARFSSVILGGNQWRCRKMSAFSQANRLITLIGLLGQTFVI